MDLDSDFPHGHGVANADLGPAGTRVSRLNATTRAWHTATQERITATTSALTTAGATNPEVIEALELLRSEAHRELDDLIDDAQLTLPPAGPCWRARRYRELAPPTRLT